MRAALFGAFIAAFVLIEFWANLNPIRIRLGLPELSSAAFYRQPSRSAESQQATNGQSNTEIGSPAAAADPGTHEAGQHTEEGKGLDWPAWIQATSAIVGTGTAIFLARVTKTQVQVARLQADLMDGQLKATERAADAAASSVRVAEDTLTISQRPWVTVDVRLVGPMTYTVNGAEFAFEYTMENVGNTPALRAFPQPILYAKTKQMPSEDVVLTNYIASRTDPTEDPLGFTIGPKATHVFIMRQHISREEIEETKKSYTINGVASNIFPAKFIGVVTYRSLVSKRRHETSFYYNVMKLNDDDLPALVGLSVLDREIAAEKLDLVKNILFSPYMT